MKNSDEEIQRFYNDIAQSFSDEWYSNEILLPVLKEFISLFRSKPRILDLGCGAGYESMRLYKLGAEVVGIDYSSEPIKIAKKRNPNCRFEVMDFRNLNNNLGTFDGISAIASLIHIQDDELPKVFENFVKVLNDKAFILVMVVEGTGIWSEKSEFIYDGIKYKRPFYLHNKLRLNEIAQEYGIHYHKEINLSDELAKFGWKCFLYKK